MRGPFLTLRPVTLPRVAPLSVTIITRNEASHIAAALESVSWADETIVVDAESHDDTVEIARPLAGRVLVRPWTGYGDQKNFAAGLARHDWILSIDADERVTPELAKDIHEPSAGPGARGYTLSRVTFHRPMNPSTPGIPYYQYGLTIVVMLGGESIAPGDSGTVDGAVVRLVRGTYSSLPIVISPSSATIECGDTSLAARRAGAGRHVTVVIFPSPSVCIFRNYFLRFGYATSASS